MWDHACGSEETFRNANEMPHIKMQQSVLSGKAPNAHNLNKLPLSHLDILFVISTDDMHIIHLNKYIKNTLKWS